MKTLSQEEFKKKLGDKILYYRTYRGLTQEELAHKINKDKQAINRYEVSGANPTAYNLKALALALEITTDDLLNF